MTGGTAEIVYLLIFTISYHWQIFQECFKNGNEGLNRRVFEECFW